MPVGTTDVNILLLLWDFNQNWSVLTNFAETPKLATSCTTVTKSSSVIWSWKDNTIKPIAQFCS